MRYAGISIHSNRKAAVTSSFLLGEAHDVHCLHGLLKQFIVLLSRNLNMACTQEAVITEGLQKKVL